MSAVESPVQAAVVRIGAPGDGYDGGYDGRGVAFWGSGFFIAPGWVLTSAHVVGQGRGAVWRGERVIGITTETGERFTGVLACGLPRPRDAERPPSPWGDPDLALVHVPEAADPDCLWLSDRSALAPADVQLYGYSSAPGDDGEVYVPGAGMAIGGTGGPLMLRCSFVPAGCSGGPVVDRDRGSVIGVIKARARGGVESARATPITALRSFCDDGPRAAEIWQEALRAHDRHHLARYRGPGWSWPRNHFDLEAQHGVRAHGHAFTAYQRAELYGRFAELPPPVSAGQVLGMVNEARREVLRESYRLDVHAPRSWREGVGLLYDPRDGHTAGADSGRDMEREAVLLYAAKVCVALSAAGRAGVAGPRCAPDDRALGELQTWVKGEAVTLRNPLIRQRVPGILDGGAEPAVASGRAAASAASAAYADVLVEIDPDLYGTHAWRIKLLHEDGQVTPVRNSEIGVPREELERDIRAALAAALDRGDIGEHLAAVDFMLPRALFDEPVDLWRAREAGPDEPFSPHTLPLGRRRTVALRDGRRWAQQVTPEWRQRWSGIAQGPLDAVPLCLDIAVAGHDSPRPESDDAAYGRLHAAERHAVPVHCAQAGHGRGAAALGVALAAGHPVALWRRCNERHADCSEFYERAAGLLRSVSAVDGPGGLPERVRALRNKNADPDAPDPDAGWARHIVLLYDPPHGPSAADRPLRAPPLRP